jgi:hypothetical protein
MGQLCLKGNWTGGVLEWERSLPLEASTPQADRLLAFYEEGNMQAQGGDLTKALVTFQKGLSAFLAVKNPGAHERTAEAALLWGLGTALDRAERSEQGWRTLMQILPSKGERDQIPLGLALNWTHSAVLSGYRHDKYLPVAALLDALQRLGWSDALKGADEAVAAVRERYALLSPFRAQCFEGLMQESRFEEASGLAQRALRTLRDSDPENERALQLWSLLDDLAQRRVSNFRLEAIEQGDDQEEDGAIVDEQLPALGVRWDGQGRLQWKIGSAPEDPNESALARLYQEAADLADRGDLSQALAAYDKGLAAWSRLPRPRSRDAVVRAMMLWGKATLEDRLSSLDPGSVPPEKAWATLLCMVAGGVGTALPLPLLLTWTQSAVIVAAQQKRLEQTHSLLAFLIELALHPRLGGRDADLSQELMSRFLFLLEGTYGGLEHDPALAARWALALQRKIEPRGLILLPLREIVYHALSSAGRHQEAATVAQEVQAWARQEGDAETVEDWSLKLREARESATSP